MEPVQNFRSKFIAFLVAWFLWAFIPFISSQATSADNEVLAKVTSASEIIKSQALLAQGAEVNDQGYNLMATTYSPLDEMEDVKVVEELLEREAEDIHKNGEGYSPSALMRASALGRVGVVKIMLEKGANVNHQDSFGQTALMWASSNGNEMVVKTLLEKGAEVNIKSKVGSTALSLAKTKDVDQLLRAAGAK